jgi:hypothetical protein
MDHRIMPGQDPLQEFLVADVPFHGLELRVLGEHILSVDHEIQHGDFVAFGKKLGGEDSAHIASASSDEYVLHWV